MFGKGIMYIIPQRKDLTALVRRLDMEDRVSGPAEILEGGRIGRLVPIADVEALAEAMLLTLEDPPPRALLLKRAECFSADNSVAMYGRLITETVRDHRQWGQVMKRIRKVPDCHAGPLYQCAESVRPPGRSQSRVQAASL